MKRLIIFACILCLTKSAFSQNDFRKGYIIKTGGDTIPGWVDYREGLRSYKSCQFKESENHSIVNHGPDGIIGYGYVNGKVFESREIKDKAGTQKLVFIDAKVRGLISLYKYEDSFFIEKKGEVFQRLSNDGEERVVSGKRVMVYTNQHIAVLNTLLFDCLELRHRTGNVQLIERPLTKLIEDYNACMGDKAVTYNIAKRWVKSHLGIAAGINISQLKFSNEFLLLEHLAGTSEISVSPVFGISLEVLSPRLSERFSFHSDFLYSKLTYHLVTNVRYSQSRHENSITIELQQLKIPFGFRYTFPERKVTPYINGGLSYTQKLTSSSSWDQEIRSASGVEIIHNGKALDTKNSQLGFWAGVGIMKSIHKKLDAFAEIRYEQTDGIAGFSSRKLGLTSDIKNLQVSLGIRLK